MDPFECLLNNDIDQLVIYLEHGNVNVVDQYGCSLLCNAIKLHLNEIVKLLLANYIDVNLADSYGNTAFHYAVIFNRLGYLKMLLKTNGNPMAVNLQGRTPLYIACLYGREDMISLFLEQYPLDLSFKDDHHESIFMALIRSKNLHLVEQYGSLTFLEEENHIGDTPLGIAAQMGSVEMASYLLANHAFVNHKNHLGETPIFYAVRNEQLEMISLLMKYGACMDIKNNFQETIYDLEMLDRTREYIDEKMDYEPIRSYRRKYPLQYAIYTKDKVLFQDSLQPRYIQLEDCYGYLPLDIAKAYQAQEAIEALTKALKELELLKLKRKSC